MRECDGGMFGELMERLRGRRFGVVGVGNVFRGDDGAGPELIRMMEGRFGLPMVDAAEVPENYGGWVAKMGLEAVVFFDAVEFGGRPGEIRIIPLQKLMLSATTTHNLSLHYVILYLEQEWGGEAILVGIEPKSLELDAGLSAEVREGVEKLAEALVEAAGNGRP